MIVHSIPRPRGRGPVEAIRLGVIQRADRVATFRARAGAAPLKHDCDPCRRASITSTQFRARAGAAPLKPVTIRGKSDVLRNQFRARAGAAPLKRRRLAIAAQFTL